MRRIASKSSIPSAASLPLARSVPFIQVMKRERSGGCVRSETNPSPASGASSPRSDFIARAWRSFIVRSKPWIAALGSDPSWVGRKWVMYKVPRSKHRISASGRERMTNRNISEKSASLPAFWVLSRVITATRSSDSGIC